MNSLKQMMFSDWHLMRIIRLIFGIVMGVNAATTHDPLSGIIAAIFLFQATTNTGCCGASCAVPVVKKEPGENEVAVFEEIK